MKSAIPSRRNSTLLIICLLICFSLLVLTGRAFAAGCSPIVSFLNLAVDSYSCYSSRPAALAACRASSSCLSSCSNTSSNGYFSYFCHTVNTGYPWHANEYSSTDGVCPSGMTTTPDGQCVNSPCASERAALEQQCGGVDKYTIDENTCQGQCNGCGDLSSRLETECGGPGTYEINTELCIGHCLPTSQCAQAYEDACLRCGSCDQIAYFDNSKCIGVCEDCKDEYEQKKQECNNPWPDDERDACSYTCSCTSKVDDAEQACPFGFSMDDQCNYECLSCTALTEQCISKCNGRDNVSNMVCEDINKIPKDYLCICKEDNCDSFYDGCHTSCDTPECGGIKVSKCVAGGGEITYSRCECNGCSKPPENPDGPPLGDGEPTPEPGDGSDIISWLKAIKGDTGKLLEQGNDHTAWFSSIKKNGDRTNEILEKIAGKNTSVNVNVDTSGIVNAIGVTNQKLDGIGGTLTDIKDGLSGLSIGTKTDGGDYSVSEGSYGAAPTDADLPTKEAINSAFGTYTPPEDSNRDLIKNTISGFIPGVSSSECNISISLPVPTLSGLAWHDYSLNFCQYEAIFTMIGNALVFLTALYELYRLA
jgi:hypothetical protein